MNIIDEESFDDGYVTHRKRRLILTYYYLRKRRSRSWICQHIQSRHTSGEFRTLFYELDDEHFQLYYRVTRVQFYDLLSLIIRDITKQDNNYQKAITPEERLAICLRFLATGDSFRIIGYNYRVGNNTVSLIVKDVCNALWIHLQPIYMKLPTESEWEAIAEDFNDKWQFPSCLGAVDVHISISNYFNYNFFYSVVLFAVVDANKGFNFIMDVGSMGRFTDGGIFADSAFGYKLQNGQLNLPNHKPLTPNGDPTLFVFLGDQAFPLQKHFMIPYPRSTCLDNRAKNTFNYRLSRARNVVENAFGILSTRFRVFRRTFEYQLELVNVITKTTCVLHNYLMSSRTTTSYANTVNIEEQQTLIKIGTIRQLTSN